MIENPINQLFILFVSFQIQLTINDGISTLKETVSINPINPEFDDKMELVFQLKLNFDSIEINYKVQIDPIV